MTWFRRNVLECWGDWVRLYRAAVSNTRNA